MLGRRFFGAGILFLVAIFFGCTSNGGHWQHFRISAIDEARERGMPIYIHFFEPGVKNCDAQKASLEKVIRNPEFKNVGAYRLAWNTDLGAQNFFKVKEACTLVALKGYEERGRAVGESDESLLERILKQAL